MDSKEFDALLERGRAAEKYALSRKGRKPTHGHTRQSAVVSLEGMQAHHQQMLAATMSVPGGGTAKVSPVEFTAPPHPPSSTSLSKLQPIQVSDLRQETHHIGKVLFVRTFTDSVKTMDVNGCVEDQNGKVAAIVISNTLASLGAPDILPVHHVFAVKEPYFHLDINGTDVIWVDHLSDFIRLRPGDPLIPQAFRATLRTSTALVHKNEGNTFYRNKQYHQALESYTYGVGACMDEDKTLKSDLYRNRSLINQLLGRYEATLSDAYSSLLEEAEDDLDDEQVKKYNTKAYFRAGRAHYELGQYDEARRKFKHALKLTPDDADATQNLLRVEQRCLETETGGYDFIDMAVSASKGNSRLDHANFVGNVTLRGHFKNDRRLFASQDIASGELLLCEKAFEISPRRQADRVEIVRVNTTKGMGKIGNAVELLHRVLDKLHHNPILARAFLELPDGGYTPKLAAPLVDGLAVIDTFEVDAILDLGSFLDPSTGSADIWIMASYLKHACNGNACRSKLGDMMIIRATRDIPRGEAITVRHSDGWDYVHAGQLLGWKLGLTCQCQLCVAEEKLPLEQGAEQVRLQRDVMPELLQKYEHSGSRTPPMEIIKRIEKLYLELEQTYPDALFAEVPRFAMVKPAIWLAQAYANSKTMKQWKHYATDALRNQGFYVVIQQDNMTVNRQNAVTTRDVVPPAIHLRNIYRHTQEKNIGDAFGAFAEEMYLITHGSMHGFEELYGK